MSASPNSQDVLDSAVLTLVLERHPAPVHEADLARAFGEDDWQTSVAALVSDGLVFREGALTVASRAAVRGAQLLG